MLLGVPCCYQVVIRVTELCCICFYTEHCSSFSSRRSLLHHDSPSSSSSKRRDVAWLSCCDSYFLHLADPSWSAPSPLWSISDWPVWHSPCLPCQTAPSLCSYKAPLKSGTCFTHAILLGVRGVAVSTAVVTFLVNDWRDTWHSCSLSAQKQITCLVTCSVQFSLCWRYSKI